MLSYYLFKIVCIGSGSVGKTSLIRRYAEGKFERNYLPTLGVDIIAKTITLTTRIGTFVVKVILTDTAGQEFFGNLRPSYYRGASGFILVFAVNDKKSFSTLPDWHEEILKHMGNKDLPLIIVGNKQDLSHEREVSTQEIDEFCTRRNLPYFETSALTCFNIESVFEYIIAEAMNYHIDEKRKPITFKQQTEISIKQQKYLDAFVDSTGISDKNLSDICDYLFDIQISEKSNLSNFLTKLLDRLDYTLKRQHADRTIALLYALKTKATILVALTKELEGSQDVFIDIYLEGLKYYRISIDSQDISTIEGQHLLNKALNDIFSFYSRMIIEPIDLDQLQTKLNKIPEIKSIGYEYGDRFYQFFEQCLILRSSRLLEDYKHLKKTLELIYSVFDSKNPHLGIVSQTYEGLLNHIPPVFIAQKKFFPDPPVFGETALVAIKVTNILDKRLDFALDTITSTEGKTVRHKITLQAYEETEITIPLGKIESNTVWIRINVLLKKGRTYTTLYHDYLQTEVGEKLSPLYILIQAPKQEEEFEKFKTAELTLLMFNFASKPIQTKVVAENSWESNIREYQIKELAPRQMDQLDISLKIPKETGNYLIKFRFLDQTGVEIFSISPHVVELAVKESKKGKFMRYSKGVGSFVTSTAKLIL